MRPDPDHPDPTPESELAPDSEPTADPDPTPEPELDRGSEPTPEVEPSRRRRVAAWFRRRADWFNREDLARELFVGVIFAVIVAVALALYGDRRDDDRQQQAQTLEDARQQQAEVLENTRFVRTAAMAEPGTLRPFGGLNLAGAHLVGLPLGCPKGAEPQDIDAGCTNLRDAELPRANLFDAVLHGGNLFMANLTGANLINADLTGANLFDAGLTGAELLTTRLTGANLKYADLRGANLINADLTGAVWGEGACYDEDTVWPDGYDPPTLWCE